MAELHCLDGRFFFVAEPERRAEYCDHFGHVEATCLDECRCCKCGTNLSIEDIERLSRWAAELYSRDEAAYVEAVAGIVPPIAPGEGNDGR